jgi:hypothetical protein
MGPDVTRLMLSAITICGCGLKLATVGMNICIERDWVMTIVTGYRSPHPTSTETESTSPEQHLIPLLRLTMRVILCSS